MKFTPGPWAIRPSFERPDFSEVVWFDENSMEFPIAYYVGGRRHGKDYSDLSECHANARLIAAAPDLYGLIKELMDKRAWHFIDNHVCQGWDERASAVLAKVDSGR